MSDNVIDVDFTENKDENDENTDAKKDPRKRKVLINAGCIGAGVVVTIGASKVISKCVEMAMPPQAKLVTKALFKMGEVALDGMAFTYIINTATDTAKAINTLIDLKGDFDIIKEVIKDARKSEGE